MRLMYNEPAGSISDTTRSSAASVVLARTNENLTMVVAQLEGRLVLYEIPDTLHPGSIGGDDNGDGGAPLKKRPNRKNGHGAACTTTNLPTRRTGCRGHATTAARPA